MGKCMNGRQGFSRAGMAGALVALSLLMAPSRGWADPCKLQALEVPVTMVGSRAVATVGINGTKVPLMVDSGAFFSFLTHAAAQQLKLRVGSLPWNLRIEGVTGEVEAGLTTVQSMQFVGGELPDIEFVVGGNEDNSGTLGVLGRNLLAATDVEYDLAHGVIRLMFPKGDCSDMHMAYWAQDKPVSELTLLRDDNNSKSKTPAIRAIAELNGKKLRVLFDTGAQSMVSLDVAKHAGLSEADMKSAGKIYGGGRGSAKAWTTTIDSFSLGDEKITNIRLTVADVDLKEEDMLLGIDFFLSHRIYISKKQRRMYFTYNGGTVFALSAIEAAKARPNAPASAASEPALADADQPSDAAGYARRGAAAAARQDIPAALADLDRACEMAPDVAEYFVRRGAVHETARQRKLALKDYETALQLDPAQVEARLRRAWFRADAHDRAGALEDLQALDKTLPPQAHQRLQLASLYEKLDLPEQALLQWAQWIPAHPEDILLEDVLSRRCWTRARLNIELDLALDDCNKAINRQGKNGRYYDVRGWLRLRRGEWQKAMADFDRSLNLRPDTAWSLYGRGIVRSKLGDDAAGQADIAAARQLQPAIDKEAGRFGLAAESKP